MNPTTAPAKTITPAAKMLFGSSFLKLLTICSLCMLVCLMFQSTSDLVGRNLSLVVFGSAQTSPNKKADRLLSDLLMFEV
jgi:hypothetical protein